MQTIKLKAYAKLNLCLHIKKIRQDGYHELDSVFQSIGLFDYITLNKTEGIVLTCDDPSVPLDEKNTCYKAAKLMMEIASIKGVAIHIQKNIPSEAGLGGGSADAAAVIMGLNKLYACNLSQQDMMEISAKIGADVPFFIVGNCMRAQGIGEVLSSLINPFEHDIVLVKPKGGVSTPQSYQLFDKTGAFGGSAKTMIKAFDNKDEQNYLAAITNALQPMAFEIAPHSKTAVQALKQIGAKTAMVTGSGSAVFGLFDKATAKNALKKLKEQDFEQVVIVNKTVNGVEIIA